MKNGAKVNFDSWIFPSCTRCFHSASPLLVGVCDNRLRGPGPTGQVLISTGEGEEFLQFWMNLQTTQRNKQADIKECEGRAYSDRQSN